jgi:protein-disulfide isomerase
VTVVLFSDFQCPFCSKVEPTLAQLREEYKDRLRIVWKHMPLFQIHPNAMPAAAAAEAAREQGKFWEMHDKLFSDQGALSDATYERYAKELGLDPKRFKATRASAAVSARIAEDQALAQQVGANGTPTMFFNCRQLVGGRPLDQMKAVVDEELAKADALVAKGAKLDASFYAKACEANLSQPAPTIPLRADDPTLGSPKAAVTLVVFSDFQCPFCSRLEPTLKQVEDAYRNQVRIVWKHQPLPFHQNALPAALAAEAAREQGKFWPMHDKMFQNQGALGDTSYAQWAREIGLDVARFDQAYRSQKYRNRILEDQRVASSMGADGTPTMFVNGEKVVGAVPFEQLKSVIDKKLAESKRKM